MSEKNKHQVLSYQDLRNFSKAHGFDEECIIRIEELQHIQNLDQLFGQRFFCYVFSTIPGENIGHFTLLSHIEYEKIEYFDSFARVPDEVKEFVERLNLKCIHLNKPLQNKNSFLCGKWCMMRLSSIPTSLDIFYNIFSTNNIFTADQMVDKLIQVKNYDPSSDGV